MTELWVLSSTTAFMVFCTLLASIMTLYKVEKKVSSETNNKTTIGLNGLEIVRKTESGPEEIKAEKIYYAVTDNKELKLDIEKIRTGLDNKTTEKLAENIKILTDLLAPKGKFDFLQGLVSGIIKKDNSISIEKNKNSFTIHKIDNQIVKNQEMTENKIANNNDSFESIHEHSQENEVGLIGNDDIIDPANSV